MSPPEAGPHDDFDRQRRRVLWAMPTGLYVIGSRFEEHVNLMTANLVMQVCIEPKLVAAAIESESVTADLVGRSGAFVISLLARTDKDVVRKFVKPVADVVHAADGTVQSMAGQPVRQVGTAGLPVLMSAVGHVLCTLTRQEALGSHTLFIGTVAEVGGEPAGVLRMEDTRMHYGG
jgi:flavin reductase (DIM6/NTAB) family NADH-FMN oxidoreductase RutF